MVGWLLFLFLSYIYVCYTVLGQNPLYTSEWRLFLAEVFFSEPSCHINCWLNFVNLMQFFLQTSQRTSSWQQTPVQTEYARMTSWNLLVQSVMLIQRWLHISCFEMALMLGKATQECGFKHCQTADYRCTNVWQTTLWEVQKAQVFPSPLMVIIDFVFHLHLL